MKILFQAVKVFFASTHNVVAWNKTAEIIEKYVEKGKEIAIEGRLTNALTRPKKERNDTLRRSCVMNCCC